MTTIANKLELLNRDIVCMADGRYVVKSKIYGYDLITDGGNTKIVSSMYKEVYKFNEFTACLRQNELDFDIFTNYNAVIPKVRHFQIKEDIIVLGYETHGEEVDKYDGTNVRKITDDENKKALEQFTRAIEEKKKTCII